MEGQATSVQERVFFLYAREDEYHSVDSRHVLGTCFAFRRPGLFLTAAHVIRDIPMDALSVASAGPDSERWQIEATRFHEASDVAAFHVDRTTEEQYFGCFTHGVPSPGLTDFALGENILSVGYPILADEKLLRIRMLKGHVQALYRHRAGPYEYGALELPFPAFPGQSGSPVLRDRARNEVIGVVTKSVMYSSERGENRTDAYWTLAASLAPLTAWLDSL